MSCVSIIPTLTKNLFLCGSALLQMGSYFGSTLCAVDRSEPGRPVGPAGGSTHAQPAPGRGPSVCVPQQGQREWDVWVTGNMRPWQRGGDLCYYSVALTYTDKTHRGVDFQHTLCLFLIDLNSYRVIDYAEKQWDSCQAYSFGFYLYL